jgi:hypothetical protein
MPFSDTVMNWRQLSAALITSQITTIAAMTVSTTRAGVHAARARSVSGVVDAAGAPVTSDCPPPGPECTVSDMSLTGIES